MQGNFGTVGGGLIYAAGNERASVSGGIENTASGNSASVGGGWANNASGDNATIAGGFYNTASSNASTVGGGDYNSASGTNATVPGGNSNTALGSYSFAAGFRANAKHDGTFVWADSTNANLYSSGNDQFIARANGGFAFVTAATYFTPTIAPGVFITTSTGAYLSKSGVWTNANGSSKPSNVIVVAKSGGDLNTISAALASISDNSATSRYLVYVAPGTYTETVTMKQFVDIEGAGELATKITQVGGANSYVGTVFGASNAELRFLTVENTGGEAGGAAIVNNSASPRLTHITARGLGSGSYGMHNINSSSSQTINNSIVSGALVGISNAGSGIVLVNNSQISGGYYTIANDATIRVIASQLSGGGGLFNAGTLTCIFSYDASYAALNSTCN